jgi:hypothetical protein
MCKTNLQSIVQFLSNPSTSGYDRQDLIDECEECIQELRRRSSMQRGDKGGGIVANPEAQKTLPIVSDLILHSKSGNNVEALAKATEALEDLASWF